MIKNGKGCPSAAVDRAVADNVDIIGVQADGNFLRDLVSIRSRCRPNWPRHGPALKDVIRPYMLEDDDFRQWSSHRRFIFH